MGTLVDETVWTPDSDLREIHVLILDSDPVSLTALTTLLVLQRITVETVAPVSLDRITRSPDLAIVDVCPDGIPQLKVVQELRSRYRDVRIIATTSYASIAIAVASVRAGAECCLLKPVTQPELLRLLAGLDFAALELPHDRLALPSLASVQCEYVQRVLQLHDGNISATARTLGIRRSTLQRRLRKRPPT